MAHRKWKETKQQPSLLPGPAVPGYCLVSFYFLWAILWPHTVVSALALSPVTIITRTQIPNTQKEFGILHVYLAKKGQIIDKLEIYIETPFWTHIFQLISCEVGDHIRG